MSDRRQHAIAELAKLFEQGGCGPTGFAAEDAENFFREHGLVVVDPALLERLRDAHARGQSERVREMVDAVSNALAESVLAQIEEV